MYRFPVDGPDGFRLVPAAELLGADNDTGEVLLLGPSNKLLTTFDPAWAKDANGAPVPTHYEIDGNTLVQVVDFTAATAFPVVADPSVWAITKCALAVTAFVGSNLVLASKVIRVKQYIAALGGFRRAAELMLRASTWEERLRVGGNALVGLVAEISGFTLIRNNC